MEKYVHTIYIYLKFYTKYSGKPAKLRLPVFFLHVVYLPNLAVEKIFSSILTFCGFDSLCGTYS